MTIKRITDLTAVASLEGIELIEVSQKSTTVTITAITISALASDNSFNDSGGSFLASGFSVDDRVIVEGFTTPANNLVVGIVTAVTADKLTIGGTDGDVIADESAGNSVTISKWTTRRATVGQVGGGGAENYDIRFSFGSTPGADELLDTIPIVREVTLPANISGSVGDIVTNPTAEMTISVKDDGTEIGTVIIATDGTFTFTTTGGTAQVIAEGSILTIVAPTTPDATAANCSVTLKGSAT